MKLGPDTFERKLLRGSSIYGDVSGLEFYISFALK